MLPTKYYTALVLIGVIFIFPGKLCTSTVDHGEIKSLWVATTDVLPKSYIKMSGYNDESGEEDQEPLEVEGHGGLADMDMDHYEDDTESDAVHPKDEKDEMFSLKNPFEKKFAKRNKYRNKISKPSGEERKVYQNQGAVIAFQPAYQIARNNFQLGFVRTFFPYLTGDDVVGPVYGTIPLFVKSSSGSRTGTFSNLFNIFRKTAKTSPLVVKS